MNSRDPRAMGAALPALWIALLAFCLLCVPSLQAQKLDLRQLDKNVWKKLFKVPQADDPAWLLQDDDGDGISNGDELAAGTDPTSFGSFIRVTSLTNLNGTVQLNFNTEKGKRYTLEQSADLAGWAPTAPLIQTTATGPTAAFTTPYVPGIFYRIRVEDIDSDGDGMSDWAEISVGLDPHSAQSSGETDQYGRPLSDSEYASNGFAVENVVTITATGNDGSATQPAGTAAATDLGAFTLARGGLAAALRTMTVNLTIAGSAGSGTDYVPIAATATFGPGQRTATITVTPVANPARTAAVVVTANIAPGTGYTVGSLATAGVTVIPAGAATGTGLTGAYYSGASATYTDPANFAGVPVIRTDATVDFTWSATTPATAALPAGITGAAFCVRWTGQIQPQYTETYNFEVSAREGCVLTIGGQTVVSNWASLSAVTPMRGSITLQAGVRYDIQLDYFSRDGISVSQTHLYWYSDSQVRQIVPSARLYPSNLGAAAAPPSITCAPVAFAFLGQPFTFDLTTTSNSSGTVIRIAAGSLPPGLNIAQLTVNGAKVGRISGTPTQAGDFPLVIEAENSAGIGSAVVDLQVLDSGNGITKEVWTGLSSTASVADIPVNTVAPAETGVLNTLEDTKTYAGNYGERIRGYITVPTTGFYYFWIAGSDAAELWISNDTEQANKVRRATTAGTANRQWSTQAKQKSGWLQLNAGVKYYVEVLHKGVAGSTNGISIGYKFDSTGNGTPLANGTGVVPGYMLWQYFPPPIAYASDDGQGDLYFTKMGPQGLSITTGSGLATIRLNAAETQAIVKFSYAGLTTAVTGKHIHNDQYLTHPSQIIFDMDVATPQPDGSYVWDIGPVGTFTNRAEIVQLIREGKSYINIHTVNYPSGEIRGNLTIANGAQNFLPPAPPQPGFTLPAAPSEAEASRFLTQATFGPTVPDIATVTGSGYSAWIANQLALPASHLSDLVYNTQDVNNRYPEEETINGFWRTAVTAPDQLRQRVAFALTQIMVTSSVGVLNDNSRALSSYYDTLADNAFGNYRNLLKAATLHPAMGRYLDMLGNRNGDITIGRIPNENYAREVLQLFSVGLNRLWPDGTLVLDSKFNPVPTYDQTVVQGYARVFTGWNYAQPRQATGRLPRNFGTFTDATGWITPMSLFPANSSNTAYHELGVKKLLDRVSLPPATVTDATTTAVDTDPASPYYNENLYDRNGLKDLDDALDAIFYHSNTGPFICRQLIQRLVTSDPSPGYVYRVVQAFEGTRTWDGQATGVRGDLREVIKAILLDYEARSSDLLASPTFGKQREPILRVTAPARYFLSNPVTATYTQSSAYNATTNPFPHRLRIDVTGDLLIGAGEWVALAFKTLASGSQIPISTYDASSWYWTRTAPTFPNGSAPRTNPTFYVDALGQQGATYTQNGTTVTVTSIASAQNNAAHSQKLGGSVYLRFFGTNAPPDGIYTITKLTSSTIFDVEAATSNTILVAQPAVMNRLANCSYSTNSDHSVVTISTLVPHALTVGQEVYISDSAGTALPITGRYAVVTTTDPNRFTINASGTGTSSQSISNVVVFPLIAPPLDRTGSVSLFNSTWLMNKTDGESTTASLTQSPLRSQTVFNFYYPDFSFPGDLARNGVTTPEFQLTSDTNIMLLTNFLEQGIQQSGLADGRTSFRAGGGAIVLDMSSYQNPTYTASAVAGSNAGIDKFVKLLSDHLMGGTMSTGMRTAIVNYVSDPKNFPYTYTSGTPTSTHLTQFRNRMRAAAQLVITSSEFAVQR